MPSKNRRLLRLIRRRPENLTEPMPFLQPRGVSCKRQSSGRRTLHRRDSCAEPFGGCCPDRAVSPTTADQSPRSQAALLSAALSLASAKIRAITTLPTSARCSGCRTSYYQWDPSDRTLFCRLFRGAEIFPDAPTASLIASLS